MAGTSPHLNQQNKPKIKVLLALITEIVAKGSGTPDYMLNKEDITIVNKDSGIALLSVVLLTKLRY